MAAAGAVGLDERAAGIVALGQALGAGVGLGLAGGAGRAGGVQGIEDGRVVLVAPLQQELPAIRQREVVSETEPGAPGEQVLRLGDEVQRRVGRKGLGAAHIAGVAGQALEAQRRYGKTALGEHLREGVGPLLVGGHDACLGLDGLGALGVQGEQVARQAVELLVGGVPLHRGNVADLASALAGGKGVLVACAHHGIAEARDVGVAEGRFQVEHGHAAAQGIEGVKAFRCGEVAGRGHRLVGIARHDHLVAGEQAQAGLLGGRQILEVVGEHMGEALARLGAGIALQVAAAEVGHLVFQHGVRAGEQAPGQIERLLLLAGYHPLLLGGARAPLLFEVAQQRAQTPGRGSQGLHVLQEEVVLEGRQHARRAPGDRACLGRVQHGQAHRAGAGHVRAGR